MKELEAVNTLLGIIGEAPIDRLSDISVNEITDSALARRTLHEVSRDVQSEGWSWNTDASVEIPRDPTGQYPLPSNALKVILSPNRYPDRQYVQRGNRIWDRVKRSYQLERDGAFVVDNMVVQLEWDEIPHVAQQYITIRAGRIFSDRYINSNSIYAYTAQDEEYARTMLIRGEEELLNNNILWGNDRGAGHGMGYIPAEGTRFRRN